MAKTVVAVEISEESVRAAEVTTGRTPALVTAGEVPLPAGVAKDSEIIDRDAVALGLRQLWAQSRIRGRDIVLGVGNRRILVREHTTRLRDAAQIRQALPFEVQEVLPVPVDQAVLDFVPTADDAEGVHGLMVAAVAEHMEELVGALSAAKLRTASIDLVAFGLARALAALAPQGSTGLLIGIGEHTTHVVVAVDGVPRFVRVIPIDVVAPRDPDGTRPGHAPAPAHAPAAPIPAPAQTQPAPAPAEPEPELVGAGTPASRGGRRRARTNAIPLPTPAEDPVEIPLDPAVQAALIDLVGRLRSTVSYYSGRPGATPIDAAWVAGTQATHPRLLGALSQIVGVPVTPAGVPDLVRVHSGLALPPEAASRLFSTVSLALGGTR